MFGVLSLGFGACREVSDNRGCFCWNFGSHIFTFSKYGKQLMTLIILYSFSVSVQPLSDQYFAIVYKNVIIILKCYFVLTFVVNLHFQNYWLAHVATEKRYLVGR